MRNASHPSRFQERDLITTNTAAMMHPQRFSWWELCEHATTTGSNASQTLALISSPSASPHQGIAGFLPLQHPPKPHTPADDSGEHSGTVGGATQHPAIIRSRHTTPENAQRHHMQTLTRQDSDLASPQQQHGYGQLMGVSGQHDHRPSQLNNQIPPRSAVEKGSCQAGIPEQALLPGAWGGRSCAQRTINHRWGHDEVATRSSSSNAAPWEEQEPRKQACRKGMLYGCRTA